MAKRDFRLKSMLIAFFAIFFTHASAQVTYKISGKIVDTTEKKSLENANIVLLKAADSVMIKSIRTDKEGKFSLGDISNGKYIVMVSYPKYADFIDRIEVLNEDKDLSVLPLVTSFFLMKE